MDARRSRTMLVAALVIAVGLAVAGQDSAQEEFGLRVAELADLLDQALYLAVAGFSAYDIEDQRVAAQGVVNLLEGPSGEHYDDSIGVETERGMSEHLDYLISIDWPSQAVSDIGSDIYIVRDAVGGGFGFLGLAHEAALEALNTLDVPDGSHDALRIAYACLLAARGGLDDPFLLAGIRQLAELFTTGVPLAEENLIQLDNHLAGLVKKCDAGDAIQLGSGTYRERLVIAKSITIQGDPEGGTTIEGVAWDTVLMITSSSDEPIEVVLRNLTVCGGRLGIVASGAVELTLENVVIVGNAAGLSVANGASVDCLDCRFEDNALGLAGNGLAGPSRAVLVGCVFIANESAIEATGGVNLDLASCSMSGGTDPAGDIKLNGSVTFSMRDSHLHRIAGEGIKLADSVSMVLINSVIETAYSYAIAQVSSDSTSDDASIQDCGGFMSSSGERGLPLGTISGYGNAISGGVCPASLLFLTDMTPHEMSVQPGGSIQAAINAVADGGTIYVQPGSYREALEISKSVTLIGNGTGVENDRVVLQAEGDGTVITVLAESPMHIELHNILLQGDDAAWGIRLEGDVSMNLENVTIRGCEGALSLREGASAKALYSSFLDNHLGVLASEFGRFEGIACVFRDNTQALSGNSSAVISLSACTVMGCTDNRAAISGWCTQMTLNRCTIKDNACAGVEVGGGELSVLHMTDCTVTRNVLGINFVCGDCSPGGVDDWRPSSGDCQYGTISGWSNEIPGSDRTDGNEDGAFFISFPARLPDPSFLTEPQ